MWRTAHYPASQGSSSYNTLSDFPTPAQMHCCPPYLLRKHWDISNLTTPGTPLWRGWWLSSLPPPWLQTYHLGISVLQCIHLLTFKNCLFVGVFVFGVCLYAPVYLCMWLLVCRLRRWEEAIRDLVLRVHCLCPQQARFRHPSSVSQFKESNMVKSRREKIYLISHCEEIQRDPAALPSPSLRVITA